MKRLLFAAALVMASPAAAHDHDVAVTRWMGSLMRPDMPSSPCCGEHDSYPVEILDEGGTNGNGANWTVKVTDGSAKTYPDHTTRTPIKNGTVISVPARIVNPMKDGNPTGTAWIFMSVNGNSVEDNKPSVLYCLVLLPPGA